MTKPKTNKWVEEKKKDWGYVLRKAYQQMEDVDRENFLKGLKSKVSDPNGYDFLEGWTWGWIVKLITQTQQEAISNTRKEVIEEVERIDKEWVGKVGKFERKMRCGCSWNENGRFGICFECVKELAHHHNKGKKFIINKLLKSLKQK